jgi:hypothetical protein
LPTNHLRTGPDASTTLGLTAEHARALLAGASAHSLPMQALVALLLVDALGVVGLVAQPAAALGGLMVGGFVGGGMGAAAVRAAGRRQHALRDRGGRDRPVAVAHRHRPGGAAGHVHRVGAGRAAARRCPGRPAPAAKTRPLAPATGLTAVVASPVFGTLSTPELCLAWRRSFLALVELPAGPARGELVAVRQSILDELERRDAAAFRRWLDAGARAGGDPARYLATGSGA